MNSLEALIYLERIYTLEEAADALRRSVKTVRRLIATGQLVAHDIGSGARRSLVVTESALQRLINGSQVEAAVQAPPLPRSPTTRESKERTGGVCSFRARKVVLMAKRKG